MKTVQDLEREIVKLEAQVELLKELVMPARPPATVSNASDHVLQRLVYSLTLKQQATLQMLMNGKSNREIAKRLGIKISTAKVHVRTLFKKFGVNDREALGLRLSPAYNAIDPSEYEKLTSLPKKWDENWCHGDKHTQRIRDTDKR